MLRAATLLFILLICRDTAYSQECGTELAETSVFGTELLGTWKQDVLGGSTIISITPDSIYWNGFSERHSPQLHPIAQFQLGAVSPDFISIRLSDNSPEDNKGGSQLFAEAIYLNGIRHPEIVPSSEGGVRRAGVIEANGQDNIKLTYFILRDFYPRNDDQILFPREIETIDLLFVIANDYRIEVADSNSVENIGPNSLGYRLAGVSEENTSDGSNQTILRIRFAKDHLISENFALTGRILVEQSTDIDERSACFAKSRIRSLYIPASDLYNFTFGYNPFIPFKFSVVHDTLSMRFHSGTTNELVERFIRVAKDNSTQAIVKENAISWGLIKSQHLLRE